MPPLQGEDGDADMIDHVLRALEHPQRRRILYELLEHNPQEALLVPESIHIGEKELATLNVELHHHHLPMLENKRLIRWDQEAGQVHKGPVFQEARKVIEAIKELDNPETDNPTG